MNNFDLKQWLYENKQGAYGKATRLNEFYSEDGYSDEVVNRDNMNEINPAALGVGQAVADAEMQKQDDLNGDMVDNASMGVVAEGESNTFVKIEEWEVNIDGEDYIIDADVSVDFHYEEDDYVDNMLTTSGGYYVDNAVAIITRLGVLENGDYRDITDSVFIKQIQDLINKDQKLNRELEDAAANYIDWDTVDDVDYYEGPDMEETVSMGVVAEGEGNTDVQIEEWEVNILGKDYIIDADVSVDFHYEGADYEDHMEINPGGYYVDNATAVITKLGVEDGDNYRYINDPSYIKQIQELINKDPKLNRKLEDTAANSIDWSRMNETVGYVMKTKPSDPLERGE